MEKNENENCEKKLTSEEKFKELEKQNAGKKNAH